MSQDEAKQRAQSEIAQARAAAELTHWTEAERIGILLWEVDWLVTLADLEGVLPSATSVRSTVSNGLPAAETAREGQTCF